jgi:meiotically up-regulated gene 157 (Mug157) protein
MNSNKYTRRMKRAKNSVNEISEEDVKLFIDTLKKKKNNENANHYYSKIRDLKKMFPSCSNIKLNAILRYLERSKRLIIDGDGYIIWIRDDDNPSKLSLSDIANFKNDFANYLKKSKIE